MHVCHTQARATTQTQAHCAYGQLHCVTLPTHRQGHGRSLLDRAQHPTQGSILLKTILDGFRMYVLRLALLCVCTPLLTALTKSLSFRVTGSPSQCWIGLRNPNYNTHYTQWRGIIHANAVHYGMIYRNAVSCRVKLCCSVSQESAMILHLF